VTQLTDVNVGAGQWLNQTFVVTENGNGRLDLTFRDNGGDAFWVVNGVEIWQVQQAVLWTSQLGNLPADGVTVDTVQGTGPANTLLTITTTSGTIVTADASPAYVGRQMLTDGNGQFSIQVRRPTNASLGGVPVSPTFAALAVDGSWFGSSNSVLTYQPGALALQAGVVVQAVQPDGVSPEGLAYPALAAAVEQAIGIWSAAGLTPEQVALLQATSVTLANLDDQGYLAMTTSEGILIDDDGVGLGWSTSSEVAAGQYDLLTAVLHEMGHVLGQADSTADDLMGAILQPGERRLPGVDAVFGAW
jgi:hypothetical protein